MIVRILLVTATVGVLVAGAAFAEEVNPIVGKVGDFVIRQADLERLIASQTPEAQRQLQSEQAQTEFVRQLLLTKAVAARAKKEGFDRKPDVKEQLSYVIDQYLGREYLRKVVLADLTVPEEELKKYYKDHEKEYVVPEEAKVRHIFVAAKKDAAAEAKGKARAKAERVIALLGKGEDFAKLAAEYSEDTDSAAKGGELGYLSPGKTNSEEFEMATFALKPGQVSPVVETPFGYHIIKVDDRREKRTATYEESKEYIRNLLKSQLEQTKVQEFLEKLTKDAGLELFTEKGAAPAGNEKAPEK
jgi:peptidyl-prolyl cis-trans isomerase C